VADETSTATSEATTETAAATTEAAVETAVTETAATTDATALGGAGETAEATTETAATSETEGAKVEVPEAYELAVPEGFEKLDDTAVEAATPVFKELGLSNEQANKLVPVVADYAKRIVEQRDEQLMGTILEQRKAWLEEAKADKEIGGPNWDSTMQAAARAFDRLGFPKGSPLRVSLDESGYGNNPELIRFAAKVGKEIGEDSDFVRSEANAPVQKTDAELFYGKKD
jgi:hypothetical protein